MKLMKVMEESGSERTGRLASFSEGRRARREQERSLQLDPSMPSMRSM